MSRCLAAILGGLAVVSVLAQDQQLPKPPPYQLPLYDGTPGGGFSPPVDELKLGPTPNAPELFDLVQKCWPDKTWFRGELAAEARINQRLTDSSSAVTTYDAATGQYVTSTGATTQYGGIVFRVPLWSAMELDRERDREASRRNIVAATVGTYIKALADVQMSARELSLMKSLERRSQQRVGLGITDTSEQVKYLERVAAIDRGMYGQQAALITAHIALTALCDDNKRPSLEAYLSRFASAGPKK